MERTGDETDEQNEVLLDRLNTAVTALSYPHFRPCQQQIYNVGCVIVSRAKSFSKNHFESNPSMTTSFGVRVDDDSCMTCGIEFCALIIPEKEASAPPKSVVPIFLSYLHFWPEISLSKKRSTQFVKISHSYIKCIQVYTYNM